MKTKSNHILERLLRPISASLNREAARKLAAVRADSRVQARVNELAVKCNEGGMTPDERTEYQTYVMAAELFAILQAQARLLPPVSG